MTDRSSGSAQANVERVRSLEETQENLSGQTITVKKNVEEANLLLFATRFILGFRFYHLTEQY